MVRCSSPTISRTRSIGLVIRGSKARGFQRFQDRCEERLSSHDQSCHENTKNTKHFLLKCVFVLSCFRGIPLESHRRPLPYFFVHAPVQDYNRAGSVLSQPEGGAMLRTVSRLTPALVSL